MELQSHRKLRAICWCPNNAMNDGPIAMVIGMPYQIV